MEVTRVAAKRERSARGSFECAKFAADKGDGVAGAGVGEQGDDGGENRLREFVDQKSDGHGGFGLGE